ncbi:formate/nitrite transporter family protein [Sulfitobacter sp.]|uniref:formate/nitrite transporter family protein n=1 Tax=Sulfitobacter sp. TaxID=1903071 RepID=UPI00300300DA
MANGDRFGVLAFALGTAAGKVLAILWQVSAFVMLDLEHSVANMYFFPQGWMAGSGVTPNDAMTNLIWVTFGNVAGGAGGVALAYCFAFHGEFTR